MTAIVGELEVGEAAGVPTGLEAATAAASETLVNCFLRESRGWWFEGDELVLPLGDQAGAEVRVGVRYRSATFRHRYEWPARLMAGGGALPLGFPALAGLLIDRLDAEDAAAAVPAAPTELLARMVDSVRAVGGFLDARRDEIERLWSAAPLDFITTEQALLLGHPLHPTPKSRGDMAERDRRTYSPELQGSFPLRWIAAAPDVVRHASATSVPAPQLTEGLLREDPAVDQAALGCALAPLGPRILVPAHPWELDHLRSQPDLADLFADGTLVDLGPWGRPVTPTTSVRTVYQSDWPWQLKFSLHVRVTNSMRVTLPKELDRAVEAARLARTEVGTAAARIAPAFRFVHDPAYLTVMRDGEVVNGFSVLLRENQWAGGTSADANTTAVTTLCQDHPFGGPSRLGRIVLDHARRLDRSPTEVGQDWFGRFCDVAVVSLVRLYLDLGLCFEAHQQNTLLELDADGWPERCVYRDSQGYFHRQAAHADMDALIPGLGEASESIFPEDLADERLVYYPFLNLTLGVINALGAAGCGDEEVLLRDLRTILVEQRAQGGRYPATLLDRLLDDDRWPCKGNLRTRYHDMDELVGAIETQSVYVTVPNPLLGASSFREGSGPHTGPELAQKRMWSVRLPGAPGPLRFDPADPDVHTELLYDWLRQPHVAPWWGAERDLDQTRAYLERQRGSGHLVPWVVSAPDGTPFGYVETYRAGEDPLAAYYPLGPSDRGWHVLVGRPDFLGNGVPRLMGRAVLAYLLADPTVDRVVCEPNERNARMLSFCRALGYTTLAALDLPDKRALLLACDRAAFAARWPGDLEAPLARPPSTGAGT